MYSLMGAGVYGGSGLSPVVSAHLWKTYVIPRVIYGLEVLSYTLSDLQCLEIAQMIERPLREREVVGSNPGRAIPKALKIVPVST